jgi:hypothetical protein
LTRKVTMELPDYVYRFLEHGAELGGQSIEDLLESQMVADFKGIAGDLSSYVTEADVVKAWDLEEYIR